MLRNPGKAPPKPARRIFTRVPFVDLPSRVIDNIVCRVAEPNYNKAMPLFARFEPEDAFNRRKSLRALSRAHRAFGPAARLATLKSLYVLEGEFSGAMEYVRLLGREENATVFVDLYDKGTAEDLEGMMELLDTVRPVSLHLSVPMRRIDQMAAYARDHFSGCSYITTLRVDLTVQDELVKMKDLPASPESIEGNLLAVISVFAPWLRDLTCTSMPLDLAPADHRSRQAPTYNLPDMRHLRRLKVDGWKSRAVAAIAMASRGALRCYTGPGFEDWSDGNAMTDIVPKLLLIDFTTCDPGICVGADFELCHLIGSGEDDDVGSIRMLTFQERQYVMIIADPTTTKPTQAFDEWLARMLRSGYTCPRLRQVNIRSDDPDYVRTSGFLALKVRRPTNHVLMVAQKVCRQRGIALYIVSFGSLDKRVA